MIDLETRFQSLIKDATLYGVNITTCKFISLLLLPISLRILDPREMGIIGVMQVIQSLLIPIVSLGLHDAVMRFYPEWEIHERLVNLKEVLKNQAIWGGCLSILLSCADSLFSSYFRQVPSNPYFIIAVWTSYFTVMTLVPLTVMRLEGQVKLYSAYSGGIVLTQSGLGLTGILINNSGAIAYMLGSLIAIMLWCLMLTIPYFRGIDFSFNWILIRDLTRYSLPTLPTTMLDSSTGIIDRFFLLKYVSLQTVGIYNVGQQVGSGFNIFNQSLKSSWFPFIFRLARTREDAPVVISRYAMYYAAVLAPVALVVSVMAKEVIVVFAGNKYQGASGLVPWIVLSLYLQSVTAAMGRGIDLANKTFYWPVISVVQISVAIMALNILVPLHGASGAAIAVAITAGIRAAVQICIAHWVYPRPFPLSRFLTMWAIGLYTFYLCNNLTKFGFLQGLFAKSGILVLSSVLIVAAAVKWKDILILCHVQVPAKGRKQC